MPRRPRKRSEPRPIPAHWTSRPASPSSGRVVRANLRWALGWTLPMALLYCVWASVVALLRGSAHFAQYGVTLRTVIGTCLLGGLLAGLLLGLGRPLLRWRLGAVVVGALAGTAVYSAIGISMDGAHPATFALGAFLGVLVGGILGGSWWQRRRANRATLPPDAALTLTRQCKASRWPRRCLELVVRHHPPGPAAWLRR